MSKKLPTMLTSIALTLTLAGNSWSSFADLELIRVYYDRNGAEIATVLGKVKDLLDAPSSTIAGSFNSLSTGYANYFALDRATNQLWVTGSTTTPSAIIGGSTGLTGLKSGTTNTYSWYNLNSDGINYTGLTSAINSYKNKISATQGSMANAMAPNTRPLTEANLTELINGTKTSVTQSLYFWNNALTTVTAEKTGVSVATITTNANGSTTISVNGTCGSAHGVPVAVAPTAGLCWAGTASAVTGADTGPWSWSCEASTTASCTTASQDSIAPTVTFSTSNTSSSATIDITFSATDNVAVTGYLLTETATPPLTGDAGWVASAPASYTFSGITPGILTTKTVYAWAKDAAGNISAPVSAAVDITIPAGDTTPPVATITTPSPFTSATVDIAFTITDDTGVTGYQLSEAGSPPAADDLNWISISPAVTSFSTNTSHTFSTLEPGASSLKTLYVWAKDGAQNVSNADPTANVQLTILKPVKITGNAPPLDPYFMQLQGAFNAVADGDSILAMGNSFTEPVLNLNRPGASVTLRGGFDSGYAANTGGMSTLRGQLLISNGNLVTENLVIN